MLNFIAVFLMVYIGVMLIKQKNLSWWHLLGILIFGLIWDALLVSDIFTPKKDNQNNDVQLLED